ncbi:uncharacterized protein LOC121421048 [Lytechinus variegatus]|uniref:uncharacterized protein LOC121421048 n=1 Tax=Lytechinus variegatus TaxID=7654 RepID=UPI001BB1A73A|nr:uncharacterized protein LOC121421048 [Lytechinus variegatus]
MKFIFGGTVVFCCIATILAQWDCISLLNQGEYYGNTTTYCDNYACGDECISFGFDLGPVCDFTGYDLLPSCYNDFGDQETCDVPPCHEHAGCYSETTRGSDYRGLASHTENGYRCQPWKDVVEESWDASSYPDTGLEDNFCRNPDYRDRPWCFYVNRDGHTDWTYCAISPCKTTALSEFTRIKNSYNTAVPDPPGNEWNSLYFDENTLDVEEKCALLCLEETSFSCRQFHVAIGSGYCEWLEYGEYHLGNPVDYRYDTKGDVFLRIDTYCDGFYRDVTPSTCSLPLGMESSWIPDADIRASSYLDEDHAPRFARLHGNSSWIPDPADREPFIQVRFQERMIITGLLIQGGGERDTMLTSLFHLTFSVPGYDRLIFYQRSIYDDSIQFFSGNSESTCVVQVSFERPILTHEIQVWPYVRSGPVALRLEFLGCKDNGCDETITGASVPAAYFEASSFKQSGDFESATDLNPFRRGDIGWIPGPAWEDPNPWLQVTFLSGHNVVGMMSRKCGDETQGFGWLTVLDLEWVPSGNTNISQLNSQKLHNLVLNYTGEGSLARLYFNDVIYDTRVVRIIPTEWGGEYQCLSMILMGCDYSEYSESLDDIDHEQLLTDVTCLGCNTDSLSRWRLHHYASDGSSGIAFPTQTEKWVQIQFGRIFIVTGLDTQGGTGLNISFVTDLESHIDEYTLSYQTTFDEDEQGAWRKLVDMRGEPVVFYGLRDPFGVTTSKIDQPFLAVRLRIHLRQREDVYMGRVRFRIRGTELIDISQLCTDNQILFRGYCIGVVETEGDGICNDAFLPGSYPLAIKSEDIQNLLLENRERLPVAKELVIGLRSDVNGVYSWPDGTPVLYNNFAPFTVAPIGKEACSFINFFNCFVWEFYDCTPSDRSTICQGDLNECLVPGHNCAHNCVNDDGGYHCECRDDFRLRVDFRECEDVCFNSFDAGYLPWANLRTGTCFHPVLQMGTFEEAVESCQLIYGRLPSLLEANDLQGFFNITDGFLWAAPPPGFEAPQTNDPLCYAAEFPVVGNVSAGLSPCNGTLQFACIRDVSNTKIQDLLDDDVRNITLDVSFGYIELRAYSPWYYTGTTISITIVGVPGLQTRIDILNMELRTFSDGVQGSRCLDTLSIYDPMTQGYREICGHLPPFRLIMPTDIALEISIGELQVTMEPLGFSLYYEIVDCQREQCITGCGESSLVYEDGILGTSPFPSTFSPFSECQVRVIGPPDQYIAINFTDYRMNTVGSMDMCSDLLVLYSRDDWNQPIERGCTVFPSFLITNTSQVDVRLSLGLEMSSDGFQALVTFVDKPGCFESSLDQCMSSSYECGGTSGIILSPNYPELTRSVEVCSWTITTPVKSYIRLNITDFVFNLDCTRQRLEIMEQNAETGVPTQLAVFCRDNPPSGILETNLNSVSVGLNIENRMFGIRMSLEYEAAYFERPYSNGSISDQHCPPTGSGDTRAWDYFNGNCYQFVQHPTDLTWVAAEDECTAIAESGHLVSIRSRDEAMFIHYMLTSQWPVQGIDTYIGLGSRTFSGIFQWTDGSPMTYTDWYIPPFPQGQPASEITRPLNEPDGGGLDACTQIEITSIRSTASWHDIPCLARSSNRFICKVPALSSNADIRSIVSVQPEYINPSSVPNCPATMITCGTGECVHSVYTCDRHEDCSDGTDERNCTDITSCSSSDFQCDNGECIPISFYCDNVDNCEDGSDEDDCAPYTCNEGEFRCDNGRCIADNLICDLVDHCFDNSDETSCGSSSENIFTCYSGDDHPLSVQCDGIVDCIGSSAEDELSTCEYRQLNHGCSADEIECNNGACVSRDSQCIYDIDPSSYITGCRDVSHLRSCDDFECPAYFMKCPGSYCVPLRFRCNGVWDCANGEDEMECSSFVCPAGTYSCRRSTICLPPNQVCDGIRHCSDADDEQFCGVTCPVGCNCTGLVFSCVLPTTQDEDPSYVFSPTAKKISIMSVPLILGSDVHTLDEDQVSDEDHVTPSYSFNPVDHPFLAELELVDDDIKTIPSTSFTQNQDLYYLSLRENPIQYIEFGAFANLTNLRVLDIRETTIPSTDAIRKALQEIPSLDKVYADSFAFCCMLDLHPADASDSSGCIAPIDQFSSCNDLLEQNTLRVAMWILGISALAGNLCTIGLRVFRRKSVSSTRIQAKLITHLAVSDLLMGVYMLIIAIADQYYMGDYAINADRWRGSVVCRIAGLMSTLSSEVSVFIIMLISIDRVLCIVFSQHHHLQFSNKSSSVCLAVMWAAALVISLVPAFHLNYFGDRFYGRSSVCLGLPLSADRPDGWEYSLSIFLGLNLVCFLITALCYVAIFVTVHRSARKVAKGKDTGRHVRNGTSMQVKLATRMAMIVGTDFICWMPIIIMGFLATSGAVEIPPDVYAWTAVFILPLNSSLNPYLYTISTIWQQHKAKQKQKELRESEGTQLSVSAAVVALPERAPFNGVPQEKYTHLTTECILTPYNAQNIARNLVPLSKYIEDRGHPPSVVDSSLILNDVRRALSYLKAKSITNFTVTEDRIALQLNSNEEIVRAFLVNCDTALLEPASSPKTDKRGSIHRNFMNTFMENIKDLNAANGQPNGQGSFRTGSTRKRSTIENTL